MLRETGCLLEVVGLKTCLPLKAGLLRRTRTCLWAVDDVSFAIRPQQVFGLVGPSGSGKTTVARTIAGLVPAAVGNVIFDGIDLLAADRKQLRLARGKLSLVFQDPYASLNPRMTIRRIVGEPLIIHGLASGRELTERLVQLLRLVGLSPAYLSRYPAELSSGQRQRIGLARALALEPKLIILDEPLSALDVSTQSQILNLLRDLQRELGLTLLFITHDLRAAEYLCDVVAVMHSGKIIEQGPTNKLFANPSHPYTRALLSAVPRLDLAATSP